MSPEISSRHHHAASGFTLVELAVVIAIIALLLGALLRPIETQHQVRSSKATKREMVSIKEALIGFGVAEGRLPCPDSDGDGLENPTQPAPPLASLDCTALEGALPWVTLGIEPTDAWGRIFRYRVTQEFAHRVRTGQPPTTPGQLDLTDSGEITVVTRDDDPITAPVDPKSVLVRIWNAAAVLISVGNNGAGGTSLSAPPLALPTGTDELSNVDGVYVTGTATGADGSANLDDAAAPVDFVTAGVESGQIVVNTTDGSHSLVTGVAATTLSVAGLIGGIDNDFDTGDRYAVSPFVARTSTPIQAGCNDDAATANPLCEFDDQIVWIAPAVLMGPLVEVDRLP